MTAGCIKPNPDFVERSTDSSATTASEDSSGSGTAGSCDMQDSSEASPIQLGTVAGGGVGTEDGNFNESVDEVWYQFRADAGLAVATLVATGTTEAGDPIPVCAHFACSDGIPGLSAVAMCRTGTMQNSAGGKAGCCGEGTVDVQYTCLDGTPDPDVFLQVSAPSSEGTCTPFELGYSVSALQ